MRRHLVRTNAFIRAAKRFLKRHPDKIDPIGLLDMKPHLGFGVFQQLADYDQFRKVRVAFDTVEWDCGIDLDPEFVYRQCTTRSAA